MERLDGLYGPRPGLPIKPVVIVLDNGPIHVSKAATAALAARAHWLTVEWLPNITLIPLPAKCPELNPQENVWQFMRENWLSNRVFKSFKDIVDHCCDAWNKLIDQPWRIMSIGIRDWAYRS